MESKEVKTKQPSTQTLRQKPGSILSNLQNLTNDDVESLKEKSRHQDPVMHCTTPSPAYLEILPKQTCPFVTRYTTLSIDITSPPRLAQDDSRQGNDARLRSQELRVKGRRQSMNEQSHYKQEKTKTRPKKAKLKRHVFNIREDKVKSR
ncbi:hypothetical protein Tco_0356402 [Tanacetum coccineum]